MLSPTFCESNFSFHPKTQKQKTTLGVIKFSTWLDFALVWSQQNYLYVAGDRDVFRDLGLLPQRPSLRGQADVKMNEMIEQLLHSQTRK